MRWRLVSLFAVLTANLLLWAWFTEARLGSTSAVDKTDNVPSIPVDNPKLYEHVQTAEDWRNPYLQVQGDLVSIRARGLRTKVPVGQVMSALRALPVSAWPYGEVVAVDVNSRPQTAEAALLAERTRVQLDALLKANDIAVNYWP